MTEARPDDRTIAPDQTPPDTPVADARHRRRVGLASFTGTLIEFYDFQIYGIAAALVFPKVLFPALGTAAGLVASFATLGVAFVARPVGSIIFGHFGDRLGRKKTLVVTLVAMGVATVGVGLVPTAAQIGVAAPIIVVLLRVVQGLAAGGEWAGATLFATEHAPAGKRGLWAVFPQLGATLAPALVNLTFLVTGFGMSDEAFLSWGWRIPFLASILLVAVGLWVRLSIGETPVFKGQVARTGAARLPFMEALRGQPREILIGGGTAIMAISMFYLAGSYLTNYATTELGLNRNFVLGVGFFGALVLSVAAVAGAVLSDRVGRRKVIGYTTAVGVVWALFMFPILGIGTGVAYALVICVTMILTGLSFGPVGAFLPELFETRYRYTAAGFSYNIAGMIGGAVPPLVAAALTASFGGIGVGVFLALLALIGTVCTFSLPETRDVDMVATR